jgi:hypothetical protein
VFSIGQQLIGEGSDSKFGECLGLLVLSAVILISLRLTKSSFIMMRADGKLTKLETLLLTRQRRSHGLYLTAGEFLNHDS